MARFTSAALLDMRQLNGGAGALSSNSMQFSPPMGLSSENFLMLDSNPSPSSSMDLGSLNPSLSSNITSDFSSFLESTSQNSFNMGMGSAPGVPPQSQAVQQNDMLLPADEWSGTTNTGPSAQSSHRQHGLQSSSPNQCQSSVSQGQQASQIGNPENKRVQQYGFDQRLWGSSQNAHEIFGMPQLTNQDGMPQGGDNQQATGGQQQGFQMGLKKPNFPSKQPGQVGFQNQVQASDVQAGFLQQQQQQQQQLPPQAGNPADVSSGESAPQEVKNAVQPMDYENQASHLQGFAGAPKMNMHMNSHNLSQPSAYQRAEMDSQQSRFQALQQPTNQQAMFQRGPALNQPLKVVGGHGMQQGELHGDPVMQSMRGLGFQMQGANPQNALQAQLQEQYVNLTAQAGTNGHPLPVLLQNQAPVQSQAQMQTLAQAHAQGQALNQQVASNQQAVYQARQLQAGSHQPLFHNNPQASFHLGQSQGNQGHQPGSNPGSHLTGIQHLSQFQPRPQNPIFPGLKVGPRHMLQGSPSSAVGYVGNSVEGVRTQMTGVAASRCLQVLMLYIQEQRKRPQDNNIYFWRKLVQEFFAPGATERWCLSSYSGSQMSRNAQGLFPMDCWFCNICGVQPGRGFEYSTDVLPRLFKIKYDSGLLEELLCLDTPEESYMVPPGRWVLEFPHVVHESIFPELRVVRSGKLRVTFNNALKILSWEFCAKVHEEVVPRKNFYQQAQQLANLVLKTEQEDFDKDPTNLKVHCNMFTACARQMKSKLEAPNVNDLGFSKRYVRCLQIAEVVNSMKDLISFVKKTHLGPIESLGRFPTVRKLQSEGILQQSSITQVMNQLTQGSGNPTSPYPKMVARLPLPTGQGLSFSHASSSVLQGNDPLLSKSPSAINQLHVQLRNQLEVRNQGLMQTQAGNQMQPPSGSHVDSANQGQSLPGNQLISQFMPQAHSSVQGQPLGQSSVPCQIRPQILACQSTNMNNLGQQMYDQGVTKQNNFQPSNQVMSQSRSLNRTGQQSLPGTPQSDMSDMRSNT